MTKESGKSIEGALNTDIPRDNDLIIQRPVPLSPFISGTRYVRNVNKYRRGFQRSNPPPSTLIPISLALRREEKERK